MRAIDADALKRKAQKVATDSWKMKVKASVETVLNQFIDWIDDAPTIKPERKTGKWICSDDVYETAVCSCCGWDTTEPWQYVKNWFKFCPRCGEDMRGEPDESD